MSKFIIIALIVVCSITLKPAEILADSPQRNILVLFSLSPTIPAYRPILEGIRQKLSNEFGDGYNLHIEYLDTDKFPKGAYPKEKFRLYNEKYEDIKIDLLICIGVNIIPVLKANADSSLLNLPAVSLDFDLSNLGINSDLALNNQTSVLGMKLNIGATLSEIYKMLPGTKAIYLILGSSRSDSLYALLTKKEVKNLEGQKKIFFLDNLSMDEILKRVHKLPDNSIILIPSFNADNRGIQYYTPESVRLITSISNVPVFTATNMGFGEGAVGGYILNFTKAGQMTGESAVKILKGFDPNTIKISEKDYYDYLFDWRELKKWNISESKLPKGSTILYEEINFFRKYLWVLFGGVLILILQSLFIVRLIRMHSKQKELNKKIIETQNRYQQLYREDRILRLGKLTASLSHELNQPLTAILSMAQAGIRFIDTNNSDPELMKEIFNNIVDDDKRAASILNVVRGMMKNEKREKEKVNLNKIISEIVELYRSRSIEVKSTILVKLTDFPVYIMADTIQLQQVILNLLSNAQQSMKKAIGLNKKIIIEAVSDKEFVTVSVRDFGKGIDEAFKNDLFKPFATSRKEGFGMGLAISRSIIEDHLGKIWAENMPEGGAQFSFKLNIYEN